MASCDPSRPRVLFVDDEPSILSGLRRMLRNMRKHWDMAFLSSPQEALEQIRSEHFDVIVADMRMPGMTGAQLLAKARELLPASARIILSGQTEQEHFLGALGTVHQFLAKPCDSETIRATIDRARALQQRLSDPQLAEVIGSIEALPSPPRYFTELIRALDDPSASAPEIADLVSQDPGLVTRVLRIVNSALFGLRREISDVTRAVTLLGCDMVKSLALSAKVLSYFDQRETGGLPIEAVWDHGLATGRLAERIARDLELDRESVQRAFLGGLLHDVGKLALAVNMPERYREVLAHAEREKLTHREAERALLGTTHAEIGACLLALWGMPEALVNIVAHHHTPAAAGDAERADALSAVHIADVLSKQTVTQEDRAPGGGVLDRLDEEYLARLGLLERVASWAA